MMKTVSQAGASVCLHRRLRTFGERPNMRKKPFCARFSRKTSGFRMVGAMRERPRRGAARSFHHTCLRALAHGHKNEKKRSIAFFSFQRFASKRRKPPWIPSEKPVPGFLLGRLSAGALRHGWKNEKTHRSAPASSERVKQ